MEGVLGEGGMRISMEKTKVMVTGEVTADRKEVGRYPCNCCGTGVGVNSLPCTRCRK